MATKKDLEFDDRMKLAILNKDKTCMSRHTPHGRVGDEHVFEFMGNTVFYKIDGITKMTLRNVATNLYEEEGFGSPDEFKEFWNKCYPKKPFHAEEEVYVHFLTLISVVKG